MDQGSYPSPRSSESGRVSKGSRYVKYLELVEITLQGERERSDVESQT